MTIANANQLIEDNEIAFLHADICLASPNSYSLDEKRQICEEIDATNAAIDAAMCADFESMPDFMKKKLLDMLGAPGTPERSWWESILLDFDSIPDAHPTTEQFQQPNPRTAEAPPAGTKLAISTYNDHGANPD